MTHVVSKTHAVSNKIFSRPTAARISLLLLLALGWLWQRSAVRVEAQTTSAELRGTVEDASGAIVAGATVTVTNKGTGIVRTATSNNSGAFSVPGLQPAAYEVVVTAPNFSSTKFPNVVLTVGAEQVLNVALPVAQVSQTVTVSGAISGVQLASSSLGAVVDGRTTRALPLNGRDWASLADLEPGVAVVRTQNALNASNSNRGSRGLGTQIAVNGNRPTQNNYFVDGISENDYANGTPGSAIGLTLGVDAIQEFSVITSNYDATYGQTSGGVINGVTRSGTNHPHGEVYEFLRNDIFDARNYFDKTQLPLRRNQYGAAIGGPIWKDRTFFFVNYEGLRWAQTNTTTSIVPSAKARQGLLVAGPVVVDPKVKPFLALWPVGTNDKGDTATYSFTARNPSYENFGTIKLDNQFNQKDSLAGVFSVDDGNTSAPDSLNSVFVNTTVRRDTESIAETHIFNPSMLNVARVGVNRVTAHALTSSPGNNPAASDPALGILPGRDAPALSVPPLTFYSGGENGLATTNFFFTTYQGYDDLSIQRRAHTVKAGVDFIHYTSNMQVASTPNGEYDFNGLKQFLTNQPNIFYADLSYPPGQTTGIPTGVGFPERGFRQDVVGVYIQDDWRVKDNLTVNLGLRYERANVVSEEHNRVSNIYDLSTTNLNPGAQLYNNPTNKNFEPRVGFAYDPYKNGRTSVRGAFGIFDVLPLIYEMGLQEAYAAPFSALAQIGGQAPGSFPNGGYAQIISGKPIPLRVAAIQRNPARNYVMQYSMSVQQQVAPSTTFLLAYAGSRGVHMSDLANDANYGTPVLTSRGYEFNSATRNLALGGVRQLTWGDNSFYNALQAQLNKQFSHGFQLKASFTWSKSIDGFSSTSFPTTYQNSISLLFFNLKLNRGPSDFSVPRVAVINGLWQVPKIENGPTAVKALANGWAMSGILQLNDGLPFTPVISGDALREQINSPFDVPNRLNGPGCQGNPVNPGNVTHYIKTNCFTFAGAYPTGVLGNAGRNSIVGPGLAELDISGERNFGLPFLSQASHLQFRADAFNILNRPNFEAPVANNKIFGVSGAPITTAGLITSTATTSRQIQLALRLIF